MHNRRGGKKQNDTRINYNDFIVNPKGKINISKLKSFAVDKLFPGSMLREILLLEDNEMCALTFLERVPIYLRLARLEDNQGRRR